MFGLSYNRKHLYYLALFVGCFFLLTFDLAFAQDVEIKKEGISGFMYDIFITVGGAFLWLAGQMFDITINNLVIYMGNTLDSGASVAINTLWVIIRDLFNILFIFGLIYIGFKTILGIDESGTRRWLISLVGAALLINFSLYFTQVVIEFSNTAARQIHSLIIVNDKTTGLPAGISQAFMDLTDIETYASTEDNVVLPEAVNESTSGGAPMRIIMFGLLMMLFMLVTAFVFAAGAFMLIARFVILIFCMIFSPAMFLGWIYPGMAKYTSRWVQTLLKNAFLAPALLFMIYLSLMVASTLVGSEGGFAKAFTADSAATGAFAIFLQFFVIIAFMIGSLMLAKQMGGVGAAQSMSITNSIRRRALGYATAIPRWGYRFGIGAGSTAALNSFDRWQSQDSKGKTGAAARTILAKTNLDRGIRNTLEKGKQTKAGFNYSYQENQDYADSRRIRLSAGAAEQKREAAINGGLSSIANGNATAESMKELADAMKGLTDKQLTEDIDLSTLTNQNIAVHLNTKQIDAIKKSGKYSDAEIGQIEKSRKDGFKNIATRNTNPGSAYNDHRQPEWLTQKGTDEVAKMPTEVFKSEQMAPYLTPTMVEAKLKSGISGSEKDDIRDNIQNLINNPGTTPLEQIIKPWRTWQNRSTIGAGFGLEFPNQEA